MKAILDNLARRRGYTPFHELPKEVQLEAMRRMAEYTPRAMVQGFCGAIAISAVIALIVFFIDR